LIRPDVVEYHRQHCCKAHAKINRKMGNLTPCKIVTPKNFNFICIRDYVREATHQRSSSYGRMTQVASLKFQRGGELLEIMCNVMQRPVGHDQRAYSSSMLRQPNRKRVFLSNHVQDFIYSQCHMHFTCSQC